MKKVRRDLKRIWAQGRDLISPSEIDLGPEAEAAWRNADRLWDDLFAPFRPLVAGSDVLEIGCGDGRLLYRRLDADGFLDGARSAAGVDRHAFWSGDEGAVAWTAVADDERFHLHADMSLLEAFDPSAFDLILCRDFETIFDLGALEGSLSQLYALLRPGGEALLRVGCAGMEGDRSAGYGFMTPTSWAVQWMRAGFEIGAVRTLWRSGEDIVKARSLLPDASDEERLTSAIVVRLLRPWEALELDTLQVAARADSSPGEMPTRPKRRRRRVTSN